MLCNPAECSQGLRSKSDLLVLKPSDLSRGSNPLDELDSALSKQCMDSLCDRCEQHDSSKMTSWCSTKSFGYNSHNTSFVGQRLSLPKVDIEYQIEENSCCLSREDMEKSRRNWITKRGPLLISSGSTFWPFLKHVSFARGSKTGPSAGWIRCLLEGPVSSPPMHFLQLRCSNVETHQPHTNQHRVGNKCLKNHISFRCKKRTPKLGNSCVAEHATQSSRTGGAHGVWVGPGFWGWILHMFRAKLMSPHSTMSKRSLSFYNLLSVKECILSAWGCDYANKAHHEKSYRGMYSFLRMVDFQLDWGGLVTAAILTGRFAAE